MHAVKTQINTFTDGTHVGPIWTIHVCLIRTELEPFDKSELGLEQLSN